MALFVRMIIIAVNMTLHNNIFHSNLYIIIYMGKDTFEEISSTEWYFRGEFGNFEELLEIPCNGKVPLRYQDLIGMCCPLHELTLYRHCNEFN
jgi:hypothetical protein